MNRSHKCSECNPLRFRQDDRKPYSGEQYWDYARKAAAWEEEKKEAKLRKVCQKSNDCKEEPDNELSFLGKCCSDPAMLDRFGWQL